MPMIAMGMVFRSVPMSSLGAILEGSNGASPQDMVDNAQNLCLAHQLCSSKAKIRKSLKVEEGVSYIKDESRTGVKTPVVKCNINPDFYKNYS
jgi:hypothetical protein